MNSIILMGRLVKDPQIKIVGKENEVKVARYTLAVTRKFKTENENNADFINCVAFGKTAEFVEKYLKKGEQILTKGRLQSGSYTDKNNNKVYTTDVIVEEHYFCGSKKNNESEEKS